MRRASLSRFSFRASLFTLAVVGLASTLPAQTSMSAMNGMGSYKDPAQRAADAYSRGMKAKRKAEGEKDPNAQRKLLEKAKDELGKSVGYSSNYDALLALGQVQLALGEKAAALQSCTHALSWKPSDPAAVACQTEARNKTVTVTPVGAAPNPAATGTEPAESSPPR